MSWWRECIIAFCRWRVYRNGEASGNWLRFSYYIANGAYPEDDVPDPAEQ